MICIFNLSPEAVTVPLEADLNPLLDQTAEVSGRTLALGPNGFVIGRVP